MDIGSLHIGPLSRLQWVCFGVGMEELEGEQMGLDGVGDGKGRRRGCTMTDGLWWAKLPWVLEWQGQTGGSKCGTIWPV